jgi:hypothetical protein
VAGSTWSLSGQEPFTARDRLLPTEAEESELIRPAMLTMLEASTQVLIISTTSMVMGHATWNEFGKSCKCTVKLCCTESLDFPL